MPAELVITVDMPPHSGEYRLALPPVLNMGEERILKQMADCVSGELSEQLERGSLAAVMAVACIAMRRAGVNANPRSFEDRTIEHVSAFVDMGEEDDAPLASANDAATNGNTKRSEKDSSESSAPTPANTSPPGTGVPV